MYVIAKLKEEKIAIFSTTKKKENINKYQFLIFPIREKNSKYEFAIRVEQEVWKINFHLRNVSNKKKAQKYIAPKIQNEKHREAKGFSSALVDA